jgi:hypothetical protein
MTEEDEDAYQNADGDVPDTRSIFSGFSNRIGMIIGGAAVATAGLAGAVARRHKNHEDDDELTAPYSAHDGPEFIPIQHDLARSPTVASETNFGIEVEGPMRPSTIHSTSNTSYQVL